MTKNLSKFLSASSTPYHAVKEIIEFLKERNYTELKEDSKWEIVPNGKYYTVKDSSAVIVFNTGKLDNDNYGYNIVASHTDSPCLKIKSNSGIKIDNYTRLNVEVYGGTIYYTWLDKQLKIGGRILVKNENNEIESKVITLKNNLVIPSVAIHMNREVNANLKLNPQTDLSVLAGIDIDIALAQYMQENDIKGKLLDYDLYIFNATDNFYAGLNNEMLCAPRLDNLTSVYSSLLALDQTEGNSKITMAVMFDNEEVGSSTKQGAGGKFLIDTMQRINLSLQRGEEDLYKAIANTFLVSCDNAHATHPNHPELSDPTNRVVMGGGIVIKHHANQNYTTDGFSSAIFKDILRENNIKYQDFFMRSDMRCGGTLGAISSSQLSVRSVDIGIGQLAMHSNMETMAIKDFQTMLNGLKAFYKSDIKFISYDKVKV